MTLKEQIDADLKEAMRAKAAMRLNVLRQIKTAVKNKEVELLGLCDDAAVLKVVATLAKQRRDSIEQFTKGGRKDLADNELAELELLEVYLPQQLSEAELSQLVDGAIAELGATSMKDMGAVIKVVMAKAAGAADGKLVSQLVKSKLG